MQRKKIIIIIKSGEQKVKAKQADNQLPSWDKNRHSSLPRISTSLSLSFSLIRSAQRRACRMWLHQKKDSVPLRDERSIASSLTDIKGTR